MCPHNTPHNISYSKNQPKCICSAVITVFLPCENPNSAIGRRFSNLLVFRVTTCLPQDLIQLCVWIQFLSRQMSLGFKICIHCYAWCTFELLWASNRNIALELYHTYINRVALSVALELYRSLVAMKPVYNICMHSYGITSNMHLIVKW